VRERRYGRRSGAAAEEGGRGAGDHDDAAQALAALPLWIYNLFFPFAFVAMLPGWRADGAAGELPAKFGQRFGQYDAAVRAAGGGRVGVGALDFRGRDAAGAAADPADAELRPGLRVVLSATTSTGFALAEENACEWLEAIYNPIDAWPLARRALEDVRPERLIFIEAIWPNLLAQAAARGIPTALVARLSPRSEGRFRRFRFFTGPIFRLLDAISVQEPEDVERWGSLGAAAGQIHVMGNIKFDQPAQRDERAEQFRAVLERLSVPAGAPGAAGGEHVPRRGGMLARICMRLRAEFPVLFLIVVPRHVERANEAAAEITERG